MYVVPEVWFASSIRARRNRAHSKHRRLEEKRTSFKLRSAALVLIQHTITFQHGCNPPTANPSSMEGLAHEEELWQECDTSNTLSYALIYINAMLRRACRYSYKLSVI